MNPAHSVFNALLYAPEEICFGEAAGRSIAARRGRDEAWAVNPVGRRVLELVAASPRTAAQIQALIADEFDIDEATCEASVAPYLVLLSEAGLIEPLSVGGRDALSQRYLKLLKAGLVNLLYPEHELRMDYLASQPATEDKKARQRSLRDIRQLQAEAYAGLLQGKHVGAVMNGQPTCDSHTMVGTLRLNNLEYCARQIFADQVPGDFMEAGVCQGGAAIFLRGLQVALGEESRQTWVADSFQGLPPPTLSQDLDRNMDLTEARYPWLAISEDTVREHFSRYGLLGPQVRFLPGWFEHSLPAAPVERLALLRVDADLYSSTRDVLAAMYDKLSPGGYVVIDDYGAFPACREAVDEFRLQRGIHAPLRWTDWTGVFWRKAL